MISSLVLKDKLFGFLNNRFLLRLPLNFIRKASYFLQNLNRIDYNQPRSRLAMHRINRPKKRKYGRQRWNLKKYWKIRGIGLKLDAIKEEGDKEYLAEIENDDDSLEWDEFGKSNNILFHKNSGTYFGLVKFPANFSPSELALQHLCRGRNLQETFPSRTDPKIQTKSTAMRCASTMTETTTISDAEVLSDLKQCRTIETVKKPRNVYGEVMQEDFNIDKRKQFEFRRSNDRTRKLKIRGIFRNRIQRNAWKSKSKFRQVRNPRCNRRLQISKNKENLTSNKLVEDFDSKIETSYFASQDVSVAKSLVAPNSAFEASADKMMKPMLDMNLADLVSTSNKIKRTVSKISCKRESKLNVNRRRTYASSEPDQQRNLLLESTKALNENPLILRMNSLINSDSYLAVNKANLSIVDLRILTIEKEKTKTGIISEQSNSTTIRSNLDDARSRSNVVDGSELTESSLATTNLNKAVSVDLHNQFGPSESNRSITEKPPEEFSSANSFSISCATNEDTFRMEECNLKIGPNKMSPKDFVECNMASKLELITDRNNEDKDKVVGNTKADISENLDETGERMKRDDQMIEDQKYAIMENQDRKTPSQQQRPTNAVRSQVRTRASARTTSTSNISTRPRQVRTRRHTGPITRSTSTGSSLLPNLNMSGAGVVRRMFGYDIVYGGEVEQCDGNRVGGCTDTSRLSNRRNVELGFGERMVTRRNVVQLDHKSLWTEFVSDMIVNNMVRKVQMRGR